MGGKKGGWLGRTLMVEPLRPHIWWFYRVGYGGSKGGLLNEEDDDSDGGQVQNRVQLLHFYSVFC